MGRRGRASAILAVAIAVVLASTAAVIAAGRRHATDDQTALAPARHPANQNIERRVNALMSKMTLQDKLEQLTLLSDSQINDTEAGTPVGGSSA